MKPYCFRFYNTLFLKTWIKMNCLKSENPIFHFIWVFMQPKKAKLFACFKRVCSSFSLVFQTFKDLSCSWGILQNRMFTNFRAKCFCSSVVWWPWSKAATFVAFLRARKRPPSFAAFSSSSRLSPSSDLLKQRSEHFDFVKRWDHFLCRHKILLKYV